jgi:hypothetical protein
MTPPDFAGARLKLQRAVEIHDAIAKVVEDFALGEPYRFHLSRDIVDGLEETTIRVVHVKPMPSSIPLQVGECIHNARGALDYAVNQAASGTEKELRSCLFPILDEENEGTFNWRLPGVSDAYREIVRKYQPYVRTFGAPPDSGAILLDPLMMLQDLSNRDKHRLLNLATMVFNNPWIGMEREGIPVEWIQQPGPVPIEEGAIAMQFRVPIGTRIETPASGAGARLHVVLEHPNRPVWQWQPVDATIMKIIRHVAMILQEFELAWRAST